MTNPCTLDRHHPWSHVGWQYWSVVNQQWEWTTGIVLSHRADQRLVEVRLDADNTTELRPCGYVDKAPTW